MAYLGSIRNELQKVHQIQEEITNKQIKAKLVAAGMGYMTTSGRVANQDPPLSNADFIKLIQKTFTLDDQIPQVTVFKPLEGLNDSHSFNMFGFLYDGKMNYIKLAGGSKGRGSKQTDEQETSWLLVLSAFYSTPDMQTLDASRLFELCESPSVYSRVYGNNGKALDSGKAKGLVTWMGKNGGLPFSDGKKSRAPTGWVNSHISQAKNFIKTYGSTNIPLRFVKDNSKIPIVKLAKQIFPTSVPDQKFDKDKWNPADVWIEFSDYTLPEFTMLSDLNTYLLENITGKRGIIGVSLKLGTGSVKSVNMAKRPKYEVTDFKMKFGDFFSQNVSSEYIGDGLTGYSVTYRLFDAKSTSLIRGEAQQKKSLAAHGKVFLAYIDFLLGLYGKRGVSAVRTIANVKGDHIEETNPYSNRGVGTYALTKKGEAAFRMIKKVWPAIQNDSGLIDKSNTNYSEEKYTDKNPSTYLILTDKDLFLKAVAQYAFNKKKPEKNMQTRISARFQTIRLAALFSAIKSKDKDVLYQLALGMLLYGKSESDWSAPHLKAQ